VSNEVKFNPQPKQALFLQSTADITIFGGAAGGGKTWSLLYEPLYHIKNPNFGAVVFRRTFPQITMEGGLWDESEQIYPYAGATATKGALRWTFPSGATVVFRSIENEQDVYNFDGAQIPLIEFDQLESFTEKQFFYMLSRNRSTSGVRPYIRASVNPRPGWVAKLIHWWIDEKTGYAIPDRSGQTRWFVRVGDNLKWFASKEAAKVAHPALEPKSLCFILSKLDDNQVLMTKDPGYLANLMALPLVDRERLLGGNWKIAVVGNIFKPEWWKFVDRLPDDTIDHVRFWDKAATDPAPGKDPDWTAGVRMCRDSLGRIYVVHVRRFRANPLKNEINIKAQAQADGTAVKQRMEQEGGASGKSDIDHYSRTVMFGFDFAGVPSRRSKVLRWGPLSAAAEKGNVFLLRADWNQDFIDELSGCKGEDEKNDQADAASGALEEMAIPTGAWSGVDILNATTGYERPAGEVIDIFADDASFDATEDL
jgi:predicted phage terminase large subunit-like protein